MLPRNEDLIKQRKASRWREPEIKINMKITRRFEARSGWKEVFFRTIIMKYFQEKLIFPKKIDSYRHSDLAFHRPDI